jgi:hypothetical protein
MRWIFFRDVFGGWGWERLNDTGQMNAESRRSFVSRADAELDAALEGYVAPSALSDASDSERPVKDPDVKRPA